MSRAALEAQFKSGRKKLAFLFLCDLCALCGFKKPRPPARRLVLDQSLIARGSLLFQTARPQRVAENDFPRCHALPWKRSSNLGERNWPLSFSATSALSAVSKSP